ncbi:MAG: Phosphoserine transaminase [Geoglossum umbratile]|nr:MAG: Phosphoserine transaminase [Geoglossum umbratile]
MPSRDEVTYFGAGPAALPTPILESASLALLNYNNTGVGLAEHSHRSALAASVLNDTKASLRTLLDVPDTHDILFMQGGGSGQFAAVVYNLVGVWVERRRKRAEAEIRSAGTPETDVDAAVLARLKKEVAEDLKLDYLITGSWSLKASQEAVRLLGPSHINIATDARKSSPDGKFNVIPPEETWSLTLKKAEDGKGPAAFVYYCDNETVDGVEFPGFPQRLADGGAREEGEEYLVVADMSSNILSRRVDVGKFAVIFAGAQKNVGLTGLTIVLVRRSLLAAQPTPALLHSLCLPTPPSILSYPTTSTNSSLYNTLPIFDVWVAGQVISSLLTRFGNLKVHGQEEVADKKAHMLYEALEKWEGAYRIVVKEKRIRSRMNICFRVLPGEDAEKSFLKGAEERGLLALKGHRSVGGIRISNYNAVPVSGAEKLVLYIDDFAKAATSAP